MSSIRLSQLRPLPKREDVYINKINDIIQKYNYFQLSKYDKTKEKYLLDEFIEEITEVLNYLKLKNNKIFVLSFISFLYKFDDFKIIKNRK